MKTLISVMSVVVVSLTSACGSISQVDSGLNSAGVANSFGFVRDEMPVDGAKIELTFTANADGKYSVQKGTTYIDRMRHQEVYNVETIGSNMACDIAAEKVVCEHDMRPADGVLNHIEVIKAASGYDASQTVTWVDRMSGKEDSEVRLTVSGISKK